jgi:hypothetical protein
VLDYRVPTDAFTPLAEFDGSVIAERTAGEVSARCHDEGANNLALNLMHDIVSAARSVEDAGVLCEGVSGLPPQATDAIHGEASVHG